MNQVHAAIAKLRKPAQSQAGAQGESEDATVKAADKVIAIATCHHLSREQKKKAGPVVHYAFGAVMGALYGAAVQRQRHLSPVAGVMFGSALFFGADEIGVPLAGLSGPPTAYPISTHLEALTAHLVYGVTADFVRRAVRAAF
jgi:uncharacterized membrane protein YagU involved in acid resistance